MKTIIICLSLMLSIICMAESYYVSESDGSDTNNGLTISTPWKTLAEVKTNTFVAGDSILLKCDDVWSEYLRIYQSGLEDNPIYFGSYDFGEKPEIRGYAELDLIWSIYSDDIWKTTLLIDPDRVWIENTEKKECETLALTDTMPWRWESSKFYVKSIQSPINIITTNLTYGVDFRNLSNIVFENIEISGCKTAFWGENLKNVEIKNCIIGDKNSEYGIRIYVDTNDSCYNVAIHDNKLITGDSLYYYYYRGDPSTFDGISLSRAVNCSIYNNVFDGWSHTGIGLSNQSTDVAVHGNRIYNNYITAPLIDYARGIGIDYNEIGYDNECYRNVIINTTVRNQINANDLDFYDNIIINVKGCPYPEKSMVGQGLVLEGYASPAINMNITNNLISGCADNGFLITYSSVVEKSNNIIYGNIIYNNDNLSNVQLKVFENSSINTNTFIDNSLFSENTDDVVYYDSQYITVDEFNSITAIYSDVISGNEILAKIPTIYYTTFDSKTISFPGYRITDIEGNTYDNSVTLLPFTSLVEVSRIQINTSFAGKYINGVWKYRGKNGNIQVLTK